ALVALALALAAVAGDLFESAFKRRFRVEDSGRLIPGHGGFMDRLDGFVAAAILAAAIGLARAEDGASAARGLLDW
ncbi:MAG: phosphatidate cytidylyltransferase, partial [Hyphomicrobiales bacterium]|nr:phosphatidate cytidylyltransferase [Hyphomicrobiales bacterium]